ncbi:MAG: DUF4292 domain-containing protein [Bacteroides sp.]|nr:DUF4292 domain-containing protein [Bacteroides sp.]
MKKTILYIMLTVCLLLPLKMQAQYDPVIDKVVSSYQPWTKVEFSGKAKSPKLPVSLTAKLYMERDSLIQLSLRAPLLGEVGRATITPQLITIVYKVKRVYMQEPTQKLLELYPGFISDLQSLLLARVVVLGDGELKLSNADKIEVEEDRAGGYMLIPYTGDALLNFNYGYLIDGAARTRALIASLPSDINLEILYDYNNKGVQMDVDFTQKNKSTQVNIDFNSVKWGGTPIADLKLINYKRLSAKEFIKLL